MVRAVNKGVMDPFKGLLKSYFDKWHLVKQTYNQTMNGKIKAKIIRVYQTRLREAWDKWHHQGQKKRIKGSVGAQQQAEVSAYEC